MITIGLPVPSDVPRAQYAATWLSVTACQPAAFNACIWLENSAAGTYNAGLAVLWDGWVLTTWYTRIGTLAVPGPPVPLELVEVDGVVLFGWVTEAVEVPFTVWELEDLRTSAIRTTATRTSEARAAARWRDDA